MRSVALISPGDMGQAVGALLARGGVRVLTCLAGRSERTRALARAAGFTEIATLEALVRESEVLLSIVPPAQAGAGARDVARALGAYDTLIAELRDSQGTQAKRIADAVPAMPGKAHRWIAEMEEIARTFEDVGLTPLIFQGAAEMYRLTASSEIGGERPETVDRFRGVDGTVDVLARASEKVPTK